MIVFGCIFAGVFAGMIIAYQTILSQIMHGTYIYPTPSEVNRNIKLMGTVYIGLFLVALADIIWNA
jgi:hypothetical protein